MTPSRRGRLGLLGFCQHPWRSVDRTREFYLQALERDFELVFLDPSRSANPVDAVLSFCGKEGFELLQATSVPMLFAIHGGATLELPILRRHAALMRRNDTLIVNCHSDIAILSKLFRGETPNFCRLPLPAHSACWGELEPEHARKRLPFNETPDLVVGFIGRLVPQKNLHHFLTMVADLSRRLAPRSIHAIIVGEYWRDYPVLPYVTADYRDFVSQQAKELGIKDRVVYLGGQLNDEELRLVYGAMDLLIHPSLSIDENFGYVPVEAMACGVPVVGSAYGGLKDTVVHGETGYLMPTWTTDSGLRMDLISGAETAARLLSDPLLRQRMGANAREHARRYYDFDACAKILIETVRSAIDAPAGPRLLVLPEPEPLPVAGYLPPLETGWEYYRPRVAIYTGGPVPQVGDHTRVCLAAPAALDGSTLVLLDPAWPARIPVTPEEERVCLDCQTVTRVSELTADHQLVQRLVERGVLIANNEAPELGTQKPRLSVVIPWFNRAELERTLAHHQASFCAVNAEVIVVSCGGDSKQLACSVKALGYASLRTIELQKAFNKALALNLGAYYARASTLFFLDVDLLLSPDACERALALVSDARVIVLSQVVESRPRPTAPGHLKTVVHSVEFETSDGRVVQLETNRLDFSAGSRSAPGMVFVPRWRFEQVGGMNSDLSGWGWEDLDLLARLQLAGMHIQHAGRAIHLTHGDELRTIDGGSRSANETRNAAMCMANYGLGHYLGTYEDDVATHAHAAGVRVKEWGEGAVPPRTEGTSS